MLHMGERAKKHEIVKIKQSVLSAVITLGCNDYFKRPACVIGFNLNKSCQKIILSLYKSCHSAKIINCLFVSRTLALKSILKSHLCNYMNMRMSYLLKKNPKKSLYFVLKSIFLNTKFPFWCFELPLNFIQLELFLQLWSSQHLYNQGNTSSNKALFDL